MVLAKVVRLRRHTEYGSGAIWRHTGHWRHTGAIQPRRLAALLPADVAIAEQVASRLRLSTRQRKHLAALGGHRHDVARPVRQLAYAIGIEAARDVHLLAGDPAAVQALVDWQVPALPLKGGDIVARGAW